MIAIFLCNFAGGGAEYVAVTQANYLYERGHPVTIYVLSDDGPNRAYVTKGINVIILSVDRLRKAARVLRGHLKKIIQ